MLDYNPKFSTINNIEKCYKKEYHCIPQYMVKVNTQHYSWDLNSGPVVMENRMSAVKSLHDNFKKYTS